MEKTLIKDIDELLTVGVFLKDELNGDDIQNFTIQELKDKLDNIQSLYPDSEIRIELGYGEYSDGSLYPRISFMRLENDVERTKRLEQEDVYRKYGYKTK